MEKNPKLNKLKEMRQSKKWTTSFLAKELGISTSMYNYIENGKKRLSYDLAVSLADLFETTPDYLFYNDFEQYFKDELI